MKSIKTLLVAVVALLSFTACEAKIKNAKNQVQTFQLKMSYDNTLKYLELLKNK